MTKIPCHVSQEKGADVGSLLLIKKTTTLSHSSSLVRTLGFHPSNAGSNPVWDTNFKKGDTMTVQEKIEDSLNRHYNTILTKLDEDQYKSLVTDLIVRTSFYKNFETLSEVEIIVAIEEFLSSLIERSYRD